MRAFSLTNVFALELPLTTWKKGLQTSKRGRRREEGGSTENPPHLHTLSDLRLTACTLSILKQDFDSTREQKATKRKEAKTVPKRREAERVSRRESGG